MKEDIKSVKDSMPSTSPVSLKSGVIIFPISLSNTSLVICDAGLIDAVIFASPTITCIFICTTFDLPFSGGII